MTAPIHIYHGSNKIVENLIFGEGKPYNDYDLDFKVDYKDYDIIIGYRADDSYFSYAGDFVNGTLSFSDLSEAMVNRVNRWF